MGILDSLRTRARTLSRALSPMRSPWAGTNLTTIVLADLEGMNPAGLIDRAAAMQVPAIVKGRALICGTLSRHPLAKYRYDKKVKSDPWMYRNAGDVSAQVRMLWTLDDLIFSGASLWALERDRAGHVTNAARVPVEWWTIEPESLEIRVLGEAVSREEVCYFEGPQEGLTTIAQGTIRGALSIESAWQNRVSTPIPLMDLHNNDPLRELTQDEATDLVEQWEKARRNGGTAYTPNSIDLRTPSPSSDEQLFIEGRNAVRLDVANFLDLPAELLDGSTSTASLTYSTQESSRNELIDLSLAYWATPVEQRLSMDDMTPAGSSIQFDLEYLATTRQPAKGPNVED